MNKIIVEVGSTVTKINQYDGKEIKDLGMETIPFKANYKVNNELKTEDVKRLIDRVNELKNISQDIYVCGTSIFRTLEENQKDRFLENFKTKTGYDFHIISQQEENELTVYGAVKDTNKKVAVFVGGGGSTEIAIYEDKIKEMVNTPFGVIDIMNEYPDLADDLATTNIEEVKKVVKEKINLPEEKSDILILAGGGHKLFATNSGVRYEKNKLYNSELQPIMMDIETRKQDSEKYYKEISLDEIRKRVDDPNWWFATRAMCAFVLVVAEEIGAKYIVPTDISMVYGLINKGEQNENISCNNQ